MQPGYINKLLILTTFVSLLLETLFQVEIFPKTVEQMRREAGLPQRPLQLRTEVAWKGYITWSVLASFEGVTRTQLCKTIYVPSLLPCTSRKPLLSPPAFSSGSRDTVFLTTGYRRSSGWLSQILMSATIKCRTKICGDLNFLKKSFLDFHSPAVHTKSCLLLGKTQCLVRGHKFSRVSGSFTGTTYVPNMHFVK